VSPAPGTPIPPLTWSSDLAAVAQSWANRCQFEHSHNQYGENLYANGGNATPADVVKDWVSEKADYDYATNSCSSGAQCGHYTQVVWAKSIRLGCGVANCSGTWKQIWVCNYDPAGNYEGQKPY
jgi:uncharacterized protein YkwD